MKKVALLFVLAVLGPSVVLALLAARSLRDQSGGERAASRMLGEIRGGPIPRSAICVPAFGAVRVASAPLFGREEEFNAIVRLCRHEWQYQEPASVSAPAPHGDRRRYKRAG